VFLSAVCAWARAARLLWGCACACSRAGPGPGGFSLGGGWGRVWALPRVLLSQDPQLLNRTQALSLPLLMVSCHSRKGRRGPSAVPHARAPSAAQEQGKAEPGLGSALVPAPLREGALQPPLSLSLVAELRVPGCRGMWQTPLSPAAVPGAGAHLLQLRLVLRQLGRLLHGLPLPPLPSAIRGRRRQRQEGEEGGGPPCCRSRVVGGCGVPGVWHGRYWWHREHWWQR